MILLEPGPLNIITEVEIGEKIVAEAKLYSKYVYAFLPELQNKKCCEKREFWGLIVLVRPYLVCVKINSVWQLHTKE